MGTNFVPLPQPIVSRASRVMSLTDGRMKMSKSTGTVKSRIELTDSADDIRSKFVKAKTDTIPGISFEPDTRPEVANLLQIYSSLTSQSIVESVAELGGLNAYQFKLRVADKVVEEIVPIGKKMRELLSDLSYVNEVLKQGAEEARSIAEATMQEIKL